MKLRRALPILGLALVVGATAIYARKRKPVAAAPPKARLAVQFSGCARVDRGPVCVIRDKQRLTLFVPSTATAVSIQTQTGPVHVLERELVDDGARYIVDVPLGSPELVLELANARFALPLAKVEESPELERARALRTQGKTEDAERLLRAGLETVSTVERGRRQALLARILIARGRHDEGQPLLKEAADSAEQAGRISDAIEDALALAFAHIVYERRFGAARELLARARRISNDSSGLESARLAYYDGLLANATGDRSSALNSYQVARGTCTRLALHPLSEHVTHQIALNLADLGRNGEALTFLRSVFPAIDRDASCNRASTHTDLAWLLHVTHGEKAPAAIRTEAREHLEIATRLLKQSCSDPIRKLDTHLTSAEWALAANDAAGAKQALDSAAHITEESTARVTLWRMDVEARQMLLAGDAKGARDHFKHAEALAVAALDVEGHWRNQVGLGAAFERLGQSKEALAAYRNAESDLDRMLVTVPLSEGRDSFSGARDLSARRLVSLLLRERRPKDAMMVARWARIRALRSAVQVGRVSALSKQARASWDDAIGSYKKERAELEADAQNDWKLAKDALSAARGRRAAAAAKLRSHLDAAYRLIATNARDQREIAMPRAGELLLLFFPIEHGYVVFALDETGVFAKEVGEPDASASLALLSERFLAPVAQFIRRAKRVRFLAYGDMRSVDLHALPFDGEPLGQSRIVDYTLDLDVDQHRGDSGGSALIVVDPKGDLPHSRVEGDILKAEFDRRPNSPVSLEQGTAATRERVLAGIAGAHWLHFAGHGNFTGINGADSALELADGRLTVGDILALPRAPELVVLNACDAAREVHHTAPEGFGVAQAFLVRGASGVIAPVRPVSDELGSSMAKALYAELFRDMDAASSLQLAARAVARRNPKADWAAFRAFSP